MLFWSDSDMKSFREITKFHYIRRSEKKETFGIVRNIKKNL